MIQLRLLEPLSMVGKLWNSGRACGSVQGFQQQLGHVCHRRVPVVEVGEQDMVLGGQSLEVR